MENKNMIMIAGAKIFLILGTTTGIMTGLYVNELKRDDNLPTECDELYFDYLETLCDADTYVNNNESDTNYGDEQYWKAGYEEIWIGGDYEMANYIAFFNFSLLNKSKYRILNFSLVFSI